MKYRLLLMGRSNSVMDDFFKKMLNSFEVISTSARYEDIICHIKYFRPDAFVYCLNKESRETINNIATIKYKYKIPFIVIGAEEECVEFEKIAVNVSDLILVKPLTASFIQERVIRFMESRPEPDEMEVDNKGPFFEVQEPEPEPRKHILVVDDSVIMLKVIKEHLSNQYDIATATSGRIALRFLERKMTDLVLLDYQMPEEDGVAVLEKLRANEATKDIPVIFLTGITERDKIQKALVMKPQGYLLKPIDKEKLLESIHNVIG